MTRIEVDTDLIEQIKKKHPELARLKPTDVTDWALRQALKE